MAPRVVWKNPIVPAKGRPADWPEDAVAGKPLPEMTQQHHKDEVNINNIVAKYRRTGDNELLREARGYFADVSKLPKDYHSALEQLKEAQEQFDRLPSNVRKEFDHDPGQLLAALKTPAQKDRLIALGILEKPKPKTPIPPAPSVS